MRALNLYRCLRNHAFVFCLTLTGTAFSTEAGDFFRTDSTPLTSLDEQLEGLLTNSSISGKKVEEELEHFFSRNQTYTPTHTALIDFSNFLKKRISLFPTDKLYGRLLLDYQLLMKYSNFSHENTLYLTYAELQKLKEILGEIQTKTNDIQSRINAPTAAQERGIPLQLQNFSDMKSETLSAYFQMVRNKAEYPVDSHKFDILGELPDKSLIVYEDKTAGTLLITITGHYAARDSLPAGCKQIIGKFIFGGTPTSALFGLNGEQCVITEAKKYLSHLQKMALPHSLSDYLNAGKKIRVLGHGIQGAYAELIAIQLKNEYKKEDQNQIQSITFGAPRAYLSNGGSQENSAQAFTEQMKNNNIRYRYADDAFVMGGSGTYGTQYGDMGYVFMIPNTTAIGTASAVDRGHNIEYYQANLSNIPLFDLSIQAQLFSFFIDNITNSLKKLPAIPLPQAVEISSTSVRGSNGSQYRSAEEDFSTDNPGGAYFYLYKEVLLSLDEVSKFLAKPIDLSTVVETQAAISYLDLINTRVNHVTYTKELWNWLHTLQEQKKKIESTPVLKEISGTYTEKFHEICKTSSFDEKSTTQIIALAKSSLSQFREINKQQPACMEKILHFLVGKEQNEGENASETEIGRLLSPTTLETTEYHKFLETIAEAKFSLRIGINPSSADGATGTILVKNIKEETIGVFKAAGNNPLLKRLVGQASRLSADKLSQPKAEVLSYWLSRCINLPFVPKARLTSISLLGKETPGVFIEFLDSGKYMPLDKALQKGQTSFSREKVDVSVRDFQFMAIFDVAIGNMDRHDGNLFIQTAKQSYEGVEYIDNANSFPIAGPSFIFRNGHNMYKWGGKKLAEQPFTTAVKEWVRKMLTVDAVKPVIQAAEKFYPDFLSTEAAEFFLQRIALLQAVAAGKISTPEELSRYKTREQISIFLDTLKK